MKLEAYTDMKIVGIIEHNGTILLATEDGVFEKKDDGFHPIKIHYQPSNKQYEIT